MKSVLLSFILWVSMGSASAQGDRYFVDFDAKGAGTGLSWADAFPDLQSALHLAHGGDEIWVAEGTYHPAAKDRDSAFVLRSGVRMYGGFSGMETSLTQRNWNSHSSVLSGDIGLTGDSTDNSYTVVYLSNSDSSTTIDGFTICDGLADYGAPAPTLDSRKCGGGLYIHGTLDGQAFPEIRNCLFVRNSAKNGGGGVMVNGEGNASVSPRFIHCVFAQNQAAVGGGLAWFGASWIERGIEIDTCRFEVNNSSNKGGGLYYCDAERTNQLDIHATVFIRNDAADSGGGAYMEVGRLNGAKVTLTQLDFQDNTAGITGAALRMQPKTFLYTNTLVLDSIYVKGDWEVTTSNDYSALLYISVLGLPSSTGTIRNSRFESNNGNYSYCLLFEFNAQVGIDRVSFLNNVNNGATLFLATYSKSFVSNCLFHNNTTKSALCYASNSEPVYSNCLFSDNRIQKGEYFINTGVDTMILANCAIVHNSVTHTPSNAGAQKVLVLHNSAFSGIGNYTNFLRSHDRTWIDYCFFDTLVCSSQPAYVACGMGIVNNIDPLFVNADSGDYRLQPCSPLLDSGYEGFVLGATDLSDNPRIQGHAVDIGPYETATPVLSAAPQVSPSCPGGTSGSITVEVQNVCNPLSYSWVSGAASGTYLNNLAPGPYSITIADAKGRQLHVTADVPVGDPLPLLLSAAPAVCGDTTGGSVSATLQDGVAPMSWLWSDGNMDSLHTGMPPAVYSVTVTDHERCVSTGQVEVIRQGSLNASIAVAAITCHGSADGTITVSPGDGKLPFNWHWENGAITPTLEFLEPGIYRGTLTDAFGCMFSWSLPLDEPDEIIVNPSVVQASDSAIADGSIVLLPAGGTGPYQALWSTGSVGLSVDHLLPGLYPVTVADAAGCTTEEIIAVGIASLAGEAAIVPAKILLWPNPAVETVQVYFTRPVPRDVRVKLINSAGQLIGTECLPAGNQRLLLHTGDWPRGTYFISTDSGSRKFLLKSF